SIVRVAADAVAHERATARRRVRRPAEGPRAPEFLVRRPRPGRAEQPGSEEMNKITRSKDLMVPKVTTGPISASTKVYSSPEGHPDVRVPFREIALSEGADERSF